jgi:hypothetical protein
MGLLSKVLFAQARSKLVLCALLFSWERCCLDSSLLKLYEFLTYRLLDILSSMPLDYDHGDIIFIPEQRLD